jgi:hypothetical protein
LADRHRIQARGLGFCCCGQQQIDEDFNKPERQKETPRGWIRGLWFCCSWTHGEEEVSRGMVGFPMAIGSESVCSCGQFPEAEVGVLVGAHDGQFGIHGAGLWRKAGTHTSLCCARGRRRRGVCVRDCFPSAALWGLAALPSGLSRPSSLYSLRIPEAGVVRAGSYREVQKGNRWCLVLAKCVHMLNLKQSRIVRQSACVFPRHCFFL